MKFRIIVVPFLAQFYKIIASLGDLIAIQFQIQRTVGRDNPYITLFLDPIVNQLAFLNNSSFVNRLRSNDSRRETRSDSSCRIMRLPKKSKKVKQ